MERAAEKVRMKPGMEDRESGNWKLTLAYDGTEFHGWQIQPGRATVQGTLADAIAAVTGEWVLPQGSGRTDAGVHAQGQVASFSLQAAIPAENFPRALNRVLPPAVRILSAERVPPEFHARHSAVGKIYQYRIFQGAVCSPFLTRYVSGYRWPLDVAAMQSAAEAVLGEHDFTSFAATDPDRSARDACESGDVAGEEIETMRSHVRRIERSEWRRESLSLLFADEPATMGRGLNTESSIDGQIVAAEQMLTYTVRGNGFLHHMVRNLVGTFLEIGRCRLAPADMARILEGCDRSLAGPTAPANGLCLMKVLYRPDAQANIR